MRPGQLRDLDTRDLDPSKRVGAREADPRQYCMDTHVHEATDAARRYIRGYTQPIDLLLFTLWVGGGLFWV